MTTVGKRIYPENGILKLPEGGYGRNPKDNNWYARPPGGHMGSLSGHRVTEHEDGTITVTPSILISDAEKELWHGFLEKGIWRSV